MVLGLPLGLLLLPFNVVLIVNVFEIDRLARKNYLGLLFHDWQNDL